MREQIRRRVRNMPALRAARTGLQRRRIRGPRLNDYSPRPCLNLTESHIARASVPAIDAHNHLGRWLSRDGGWMEPDTGRLIDAMDGTNVEAVVNLDGRWADELEANLDRYDRSHPGRFVTFCHVDWSLLKGSRPTEALVEQLDDGAERGAGGLKVWKDLGFSVRDGDGELVLPDDRRLADLWDRAGELGLPVLIHTSDPLAYHQPADLHNERLEELLRWPKLQRFGRPAAHDRLLDAFASVVRGHPGTTFIGAHCANSAEDLAWVSDLLDSTTNVVIDIAARAAELGRQPRTARRLALRHPDRILFGSDVFPFRPEELAIYFRLLETADEHFPYSTSDVPGQGRWAIYGLDLPDDVLTAIYRDNVRRVIPALTR